MTYSTTIKSGITVTPSRWQYVFAHTFGIVTGLSSILFAGFVGWQCSFSPESLVSMLWLFCSLLIALPLGWLLGFVALSFCGPPIFRFIAWNNGAPFRAGDWVRILSGTHRERIVCVYKVWHERGQVRVELDEQSRKEFKDVFSYLEICRERE